MGGLGLLLLALASTTAAGGLRIRSDVDCPSADAVGASLRRVLGGEPAAPGTLSVSPGAASYVVRLVDGGGALVAERAWPAAGPCDAAAEAIAVVAATWLGDLPPVAHEVAAPVPQAVDETPAPVIRASPASAPLWRRWARTVLVGVGIASPIAPPPGQGALVHWPVPTLEVAGLLRGGGDTAAFAELGFVADLPREHSFGGGGGVSWDRMTIEPMGGVALRFDDATFSAAAGLAGGMLEARSSLGDGSPTATYRYLDIAAVSEIRAGLTLGAGRHPYGVWAAVRGRAALTDHAYVSQGPNGPASQWEVALLAGGDISFLP
jgi:hypothetical protein